MVATDIRLDIEEAFEKGEFHYAIQLARQLLRADDGIRQWSFLRKAFEKHGNLLQKLPAMRVALLSSFSIEFIQDSLMVSGYLEGQRLELHQAGFNQFRQELLGPSSALQSMRPDITFLAVEGHILAPALYDRYLDAGEGVVDKAVEDAKADIQALVAGHAALGAGILVMHDFLPPSRCALGILDGHTDDGQAGRVEALNAWLRAQARMHANLFILPYRELVGRVGRKSWEDHRMRHYAQAPIAQSHIAELAREYAKYIRAKAGRSRKCIVLDLDNTLWGGILGEDGASGIKLGEHYPGSAFLEFQKAIKDLSRRGIILAVASKNNHDDVVDLLRSHPHQLLREDDFAAMEVHWDPKSESIRRLASRLNIGLEHMVFVDDNPAECEEVMRAVPELTVIPLPKRPEEFIDA